VTWKHGVPRAGSDNSLASLAPGPAQLGMAQVLLLRPPDTSYTDRSCKNRNCWTYQCCDRASGARSYSFGRPSSNSIPFLLTQANLGVSFLLWRFGRGLRQGIVSAVQTPTLGSHGIAPAIVGARLTSRPVLFHIVSFIKRPTTLRGYRSNLPGYGGRSARSQTSILGPLKIRRGAHARSKPGSLNDFRKTSQKTVTGMRGGDVRCTLIIRSIESYLGISFAKPILGSFRSGKAAPRKIREKMCKSGTPGRNEPDVR